METAIVIPVLVLVLAVCLSGIACLTAQLRCTDAAGEAARLAARGDNAGAAAVVAQLAGDAEFTVTRSGALVSVVVVDQPIGLLPAIRVAATAAAAWEPG